MAYTVAHITSRGNRRLRTCLSEKAANIYYEDCKKRLVKHIVSENEYGFIYTKKNMWGITYVNVQKLWLEKRIANNYKLNN